MSATNTAAAAAISDETSSSWSLSVKAIGSTLKECTSSTASSSSASSDQGTTAATSNQNQNDNDTASGNHKSLTAEKNFTVVVSPDDALTSLYDQIEDITGLKASQQRLIYRGRIIPSTPSSSSSTSSGGRRACGGDANTTATRSQEDDDDDDGTTESASSAPEHKSPSLSTTTTATTTTTTAPTTKIKDIVGLGDGHTIHLVKRQESVSSDTNSNNNSSAQGSSSSPPSAADRDESGNSNGTASLLAALIGLGGLEDGGSQDDPSAAAAGSRQRWRSARTGRSRRPHYRLTAEDLQAPDPGTLEPVRQGLLTIHTLLPHAQQVSELASPLDANRQWYRGQWLDVRDTVNQWLEATVVDILTPDQVLPPREDHGKKDDDEEPTMTRPQILEPATDPAVGSGDLAGRRRLLLEPCDEGDSGDEGGELAGFRRRRTNAGVQLLLIHYNGWPHRWDEWIRSDSERIRPFRTRTRHPSMVRFFFCVCFSWSGAAAVGIVCVCLGVSSHFLSVPLTKCCPIF